MNTYHCPTSCAFCMCLYDLISRLLFTKTYLFIYYLLERGRESGGGGVEEEGDKQSPHSVGSPDRAPSQYPEIMT